MAVLSTNVRLYLEANGKVYETERDSGAFLLRNDSDGKGDYIHTWNVSGLVQPTDAQLNALESQANNLEALNQVYANRKAEYPDIYDYMDGIVKNDQAQIDKYIADAQDVKARYPKGG